MKVGILLFELDVSGGTQRQALCLARELERAGDKVTVFGFRVDPDRCYPELIRGLNVVPLEAGAPRRARMPWFVKACRRRVGRGDDFVLSQWIAERLPRDLDVLNAHEFDVYLAAVEWKRLAKKPIVWMMNDVPADFVPQWDPRRPWRKLERLIDGKERENRLKRAMVGKFDAVLALSDLEAESFRRRTGRRPQTVRSGLDIDCYAFLPRPAPASRPLRLFSNAILYPHRRLEDIVDAASILARRQVDVIWTHAGDATRSPDYSAAVRRRISAAGLDGRVRLLGVVSDADLVREYQEADIFLFPNAPQSWGLAPFEAMACGTPVIVSRGAGASEVLTHGKNALLVAPFSPAQIADAVCALNSNQDLWRFLHVEGRRFVEENIRWDLYTRRMREVFTRVASAGVP